MGLPFTADQFFDVFAAYNARLWPFAVVLWLASAYASMVFTRGRSARTLVLSVLAINWLWAGVAYHVAFFSTINPAATLFGALSVLQGLLLAWQGLAHTQPPLMAGNVWRRRLAMGLLLYALLYPAAAMASNHAYPRVPTFGVPCPTTILTIGVLIGAGAALPRYLAFIPILWAAIGGSAAFLLGVRADFMLLVAGAVMAADVIQTGFAGKRRHAGDVAANAQ